jgi:TetR/AcrR family transcriptional regulator, fatty acid metabolism regulator protein
MSEKPKDKLSFIEEARRKQIIDSAIEIIAKNGFQNTSMEDIAENVHVSKGVITYHFQSKTDLINSVLVFIIDELRANRFLYLQKESSALGKLLAYIYADFEFFKHNPDHMRAFVELWGSMGSHSEKKDFEKLAYVPGRTLLHQILSEGQDSGEFIDMDTYTTACVIQGAIDGVMLQWVFNPARIDFDKACQEISTICKQRVTMQIK